MKSKVIKQDVQHFLRSPMSAGGEPSV